MIFITSTIPVRIRLNSKIEGVFSVIYCHQVQYEGYGTVLENIKFSSQDETFSVVGSSHYRRFMLNHSSVVFQSTLFKRNFMIYASLGSIFNVIVLNIGCLIACAQTLFYFSFRSFGKHRRARERGARERKINIFFFPHLCPPCAGVNKSPAVYILSRALNGLWRENRGSVKRLVV